MINFIAPLASARMKSRLSAQAILACLSKDKHETVRSTATSVERSATAESFMAIIYHGPFADLGITERGCGMTRWSICAPPLVVYGRHQFSVPIEEAFACASSSRWGNRLCANYEGKRTEQEHSVNTDKGRFLPLP